MVLTSISTISPSSPSAFFSDSPSTSNSNYTLFRNRPFPSFVVGFPKAPFSNATFKLKSSSSFSAISTQKEKESLEQFLQFKKGIDGATYLLQTSIVSYKNKDSILKPFLQVDLVSTVHVDDNEYDKEYFLALQKKLESYDCVLYEMIASKEILEDMRKGSDDSVFYEMIASKETLEDLRKGSDDSGFDFDIFEFIVRQMDQILERSYQFGCLNYQSKNWQHADLDEETFKLLMKSKGDNSFLSAQNMTAMLQSSIPEDPDPWRSKLLWASRVLPMPLVGFLIINVVCGDYPEKVTFVSLQDKAEVDEKSVIIGERNRVAIERLRGAMDKGPNKIAILYGGDHMPDLGRRLREEFDLIPSGVEWITAWFISKRKFNILTIMALLIFSPVLVFELWCWKLFIDTAVNWGSNACLFIAGRQNQGQTLGLEGVSFIYCRKSSIS